MLETRDWLDYQDEDQIGTPIRAADGDSSALTYSLAQTGDWRSFEIDAGSGQLRRKADVIYDYESDSAHALTVRVDDGSGGTDSIHVAVEVLDVLEPLPAPPAPALTAVADTSDSFLMTMAPPENLAGSVVGFEVRYRQGSSGPFTNWPIPVPGGTSAATLLVGLYPNTEYEVQARAYTDDGLSRWSPSGTGRTSEFRPTPPTADAGPNLMAPAGARVTLLGSGSIDPHREHWTMVHTWTQLSGPEVTLSNRFAAEPSFTVPRTAALGTEFRFELMVMDRDRETDTVTVTVGSTANRLPEFTAGVDAARTVVENTAAGVAIGEPVTATDADSDRLTYRLRGADAAAFAMGADTGRLSTKAGVTYDFETTSYSVTVEVGDGRGGTARTAVAIGVANVDEPPARPPAPTVTAASGTTDSLIVVANAPENTGPPIIGYSVRYREGAEGEFTGWAVIEAPNNSVTLTGLEENTSYEVQVEALNLEGFSPWSSSGTGTTEASPNRAPEFTEGTSTSRAIAENTAGDVAIGEPVTATDADTDKLTFGLDGTDAASFTIDTETGQLKTRTGVNYDFEALPGYSITVTADDGRGGTASIDVAIGVTDVNEPPDRPSAPIVTPVPNATDSLLVVANAPENTGPPIIGYNVRYRKDADSGFSGSAFIVTPANMVTLTGLEENTAYEAQVTTTRCRTAWAARTRPSSRSTPPRGS